MSEATVKIRNKPPVRIEPQTPELIAKVEHFEAMKTARQIGGKQGLQDFMRETGRANLKKVFEEARDKTEPNTPERAAWDARLRERFGGE
jgi:hypothetical protein